MIIESKFTPARWLKNRHAQTIYPAFRWAYASRPELRRQQLELPDGDTTAVDWLVAADYLMRACSWTPRWVTVGDHVYCTLETAATTETAFPAVIMPAKPMTYVIFLILYMRVLSRPDTRDHCWPQGFHWVATFS
jgi:predicted alpha/beta-fold hydrolase